MGSVGNQVEQKFTYQRSAGLKEWSAAEQKRTEETSKMVDRYLNAGGEWGEYYDTKGEEVFSQELSNAEYGLKDGIEVTITKEYFVYNHNYDENDRRVKMGKKVTGSTYYTVGIDGEVLDENVGGYKTYADAKHALDLDLDWRKQREIWYKNRRK